MCSLILSLAISCLIENQIVNNIKNNNVFTVIAVDLYKKNLGFYFICNSVSTIIYTTY